VVRDAKPRNEVAVTPSSQQQAEQAGGKAAGGEDRIGGGDHGSRQFRVVLARRPSPIQHSQADMPAVMRTAVRRPVPVETRIGRATGRRSQQNALACLGGETTMAMRRPPPQAVRKNGIKNGEIQQTGPTHPQLVQVVVLALPPRASEGSVEEVC